tara:strand:- start:376 stop:672 length:297 start_codon:yes stop_codon:yes gene_type:complete
MPTGRIRLTFFISKDGPKVNETRFKVSIKKSKYLKIPKSNKLIKRLHHNIRFLKTGLLELNINLPAFQSTIVDIKSKIRCQPEANQKKIQLYISNVNK